MAIETGAVGKSFDPDVYEVGREKIREFADAVGEESTVHRDPEAAQEAGFRDVVAPPMFAVVYSGRALRPALFDDEVAMDFSKMVHGGQEFVWGEPVCAGDSLSTTATVKDITQKGDKGFYVFETISQNQDGQEVVRGTWTNIVRGLEEDG